MCRFPGLSELIPSVSAVSRWYHGFSFAGRKLRASEKQAFLYILIGVTGKRVQLHN